MRWKEIAIQWLQGRQVQVLHKPSYAGSEVWTDLTPASSSIYCPRFDDSFEYRLKPAIQKVKLAILKEHERHWVYPVRVDEVQEVEADVSFVKWIGDWIEYEV